LTTRGDIFSFSTTDTRLPIGPTGSLLRANPNDLTLPTGLDYTGNIDPIVVHGNTFLGQGSGISNTTGIGNSGYGVNSLNQNTTGANNTAIGFNALANGGGGLANNVAIGTNALIMGGGGQNTGVGSGVLSSAVDEGINNTGIGFGALSGVNIGVGNTGIGLDALSNITSGNFNIGIGLSAGAGLGPTNGGNIVIGNSNSDLVVTPGFSQTYIANIAHSMVTGAAVFINTNGKLGLLSSSKRFKENITPINNNNEITSKLLSLNPVSFTYKTDETHTVHYGLIAEEVNEVFPDIVFMNQDKDGETKIPKDEPKPFTIRYDGLVPLLLNEIIRLNKDSVNLSNKIIELENKIND